MNNEIEQIAQQNDMSVEFVHWFFNEKKAACGEHWFLALGAMWEGWKAREGEVTALALTLENSREASGCPAGVDLQDWVKKLAAENAYLLNGAARELNTSWMFHKTMLGAQAALVCLDHGYQAAAREWLEGTTDEAGADIPDDITVGELHEWFESQMVSNDGKSGFLTRAEAEEAIRKTCSATDRIVAEAEARGVEKFAAEQRGVAERLKKRGGDVVTSSIKFCLNSAEEAEDFAKQLREGAK
ncbi:hypothetical protein WJI42_001165 [Klebsiella aerogenes]